MRIRKSVANGILIIALILLWATVPIASAGIGESAFRSRKFGEAREAFEKALEMNGKDARAHYFLGLIEYEEGNIEEAKARFRMAYELIRSQQSENNGSAIKSPLISLSRGETISKTVSYSLYDLMEPTAVLDNTKQLQLEFPEEYKVRIYYKDGWYVTPKFPLTSGPHVLRSPLQGGVWASPSEESSNGSRNIYSLEAGSQYRIELEPGRMGSWARRGAIALILAASFLIAR